MSEVDQIKQTIKKLMVRTVENGCTEAEATNAMEMIGKLLDRYNLSVEEIDLREQKCKLYVYDTGVKKTSAICNISPGVAKFCGVKVWQSGGRAYKWAKAEENVTLHFFGFPQDIELVEYAINMIHSSMKTSLRSFKKVNRDGKAGHHSFLLAFATRIRIRLHELSDARARRLAEEDKLSKVKALVVVKDAQIEEDFQEMVGIKLRKHTNTYKRKSNSLQGFTAGVNAANTVNLTRPVEHTSQVSGLLG